MKNEQRFDSVNILQMYLSLEIIQILTFLSY